MNIFSRVASYFTKSNPEWNNLSVYSDVPQAIRMSNNFKTYVKEGYKNSDTLYKCVSYLIRNGSAIPPALYTDDTFTDKIKGHPILDLIKHPNPEQSGVAYRKEVLGYGYLAGNSFQYAIRGKDGRPVELWALRPDRMEILAKPKVGIVGYRHQNIEGDISPQNIAHLKYWNPDDDDQKGMGMSPVQAAALNIDMQIAGKKWNLGLMQNGARPPGIWKIPALMGFNERKQLEQKLHDTYSGATRAGKSPLLDGGLDWKPTGLQPAQMEWLDSLKYNGGSIANILNMPPQLIGDTSSSTYDNMEQAKAASYTEEIFPTLDDFYALWTWWLIPMYPDLAGSTACLYYDKESVEVVQKLIQATKDAQATRAINMWNDGMGTMNECREFCGLPSLGPDGDVFKFGAVLVKKAELGKYAEQSLSEPAAPPPAKPEPLLDASIPGQQPPQNTQEPKPNDNSANANGNPADNADQQPQKRFSWRKGKADDDDEEEHTGVMIALFLDRKTAKKLAVPDGEPVNDLHITLAYLGDKNEIDLDVPALKKLVAGYASEAAPLKGTTSGIGRFSPSDSSDSLVPVYASVNIPGIQAFRSDLVKQLEAEDIEIAKDFEYMPHITLAYVDEDEDSPVDSIPTLDLAFSKLWLCIGDDRYSFPIGDEQFPGEKSRMRYTKALDLSTDEEKRTYAKSVEASRAKWETKAEKLLQAYFKAEQKAVVDAINKAALPSSAEDRAEAAIKKQSKELKDILIKLYQDMASDIGNDILKQLKANAGMYETKASAIDTINSGIQTYLSRIAATKVKSISGTTSDQVKGQLAEGVSKDETVPQLAKRVDTLYTDQIIPNRSAVVSATESHSAAGWASWQAGKQSGLNLDKVWLAQNDTKTRDAHKDADGQQVGIDEPFIVDGEELYYPGDSSGSAENVCGCRCTMWFQKSEIKPSNDEKSALRTLSRNAYRDYMKEVLC